MGGNVCCSVVLYYKIFEESNMVAAGHGNTMKCYMTLLLLQHIVAQVLKQRRHITQYNIMQCAAATVLHLTALFHNGTAATQQTAL